MAILQPYIPQPKDRLDDLLKMLQIANTAYGIKTNYEQNKLNEAKARIEKVKADEIEAARERALNGEVNQAEYDQLHIVPPGTGGARMGWIKKWKLREDGMPVRDNDGNPILTKEVFFYKNKDILENEARDIANKEEDIKLQEALYRKGDYRYISPQDLSDPSKTYRVSATEEKGWRQAVTRVGGKMVPIWLLTPFDLQAQNSLSDNKRADERLNIDKKNSQADNKRAEERLNIDKQRAQDDKTSQNLINQGREQQIIVNTPKVEEAQRMADNAAILSDIYSTQNATGLRPAANKGAPLVLAPEFLPKQTPVQNSGRKLSKAQEAGFNNAVSHGIANPTESDMIIWDPIKIERDRKYLADKMTSEKIGNVLVPLKKLEKLVDGFDSEEKIPGAGEWLVGASNLFLPEGLNDRILDANKNEIRKAVESLRNNILQMKSGTAVSASEAQRVANELGTGAFSSSESLRIGLRSARDLLHKAIGTIESGVAKPSIDAYRENENAIRSDDPLFGVKFTGGEIMRQKPDPVKAPKIKYAPVNGKMTPEEAMDNYFEERGGGY